MYFRYKSGSLVVKILINSCNFSDIDVSGRGIIFPEKSKCDIILSYTMVKALFSFIFTRLVWSFTKKFTLY